MKHSRNSDLALKHLVLVTAILELTIKILELLSKVVNYARKVPELRVQV